MEKLKTEKELKEKLSEIYQVLIELKKDGFKDLNPGLLGGKIGIALFFAYYSVYKKDETILKAVEALLFEVYEDINKGYNYHSFGGGLAGIGWAIDFLQRQDFIDADLKECIDPLNPYLYQSMLREIKDNHYDYLHGAIGIGFYFLSRLEEDPKILKYLGELLAWLQAKSIKDDKGGLKWESELDRDKGTRGYNLSLSHGLASIIGFLTRAYQKKVHRDKTLPLLQGAIEFMLNQQVDLKKHNNYFPSWIEKGKEQSYYSRVAWCYGDLGIGLVLLQAGEVLKDKKLKDSAIKVLLHSTTRNTFQTAGVNDAGLCHGSAGLVQIYQRLYLKTGNSKFREGAILWGEKTLELASEKDGYAGYKAFRLEEYGGPVAEAGLLEGIGGIGLALISLLGDGIKPDWDSSLMISI